MAEETRWEYRVETVGSSLSAMKDPALEAVLDEWGEQGWEVITIFLLSSSNKMRVVAKRPLSLTARRKRSWPGD